MLIMAPIITVPHTYPLDRAEQDFKGAELTMVYVRAWGDDPKACIRSLVFAVAELLHDALEFGPELPVKAGDACLRVHQTSELNLRRVRLPVSQALKWYRGCAGGQGEIPLTAAERKQEMQPFPLALPLFGEEPPWPNIVLESEESFWGDAPFWGDRPGGIRRHQLIAATPEFRVGLWNKEQRDKARKWLRHVLPVDIFERPRLLGSIHLILTNPAFGRVRARLDKSDARQLHFSLQRWPGREFSRLRLYIREERPTGPTLLQAVSIESPRMTLQLAFEPYLVSFIITSDTHGLLYASKPYTFVRQSKSYGLLQTGVRRVAVPARSRKRAPETYAVPVESLVESIIGTATLPSALVTLIADDADFQQRRHALQLGQRWFDGNIDDATEFLRGLIENARKDILIVDAYFGDVELLRYALASTIHEAYIRILTSQEHLNTKSDGNDSTTYAVQLADALGQVRAQDPAINIEVRVGMGAKSPVHDRFLVLDEDTVWLLGFSLNEFGSRGTMAVRLPHGAPVYEALARHWDAATLLDDFVAASTPRA